MPSKHAEDVEQLQQLVADGDAQTATHLTLAHARQASDAIRKTKISELLKKNTGAQEAYFALHTAEVDGKPITASAFVPGHDLSGLQEAIKHRSTLEKEGALRECPMTGGNHTQRIMHIDQMYLPETSRMLFEAIDGLEPATEEDALDALSIIYIILDALHLAEDITGRTNEDFVVFLSYKFGFPISISESGYRGILYSDWSHQLFEAQIEFYRDQVYQGVKYYRPEGIGSPEDITLHRTLRATLLCMRFPYITTDESGIEANRDMQIQSMTTSMSRGGLKRILSDYPSMQIVRNVLQLGRSTKYAFLGQDAVELELDAIVAESLLALQKTYITQEMQPAELTKLLSAKTDSLCKSEDPAVVCIRNELRKKICMIEEQE